MYRRMAGFLKGKVAVLAAAIAAVLPGAEKRRKDLIPSSGRSTGRGWVSTALPQWLVATPAQERARILRAVDKRVRKARVRKQHWTGLVAEGVR